VGRHKGTPASRAGHFAKWGGGHTASAWGDKAGDWVRTRRARGRTTGTMKHAGRTVEMAPASLAMTSLGEMASTAGSNTSPLSYTLVTTRP
jgi:hypothetical protein